MAIDADQTIEDAINSPKSVTNAAGEKVESRPMSEVIDGIKAAKALQRRKPFLIQRAVMPDAVGPGNTTSIGGD